LKQSKKAGQTVYLKMCLRDSYFSLLKKKNTDNITVSEIVKLAGLSRMSFYRYYQTKDDIVRQYIDDSFQKFMGELKENPVKDAQLPATLLFSYFRSNKTRIKLLIEKRLFHLFFESFSHFLQESNLVIDRKPGIHEDKLQYYYQYTSGGILNLIEGWMNGEMKESDEEMALVLRQIKEAQSSKFQ